MPPLPAVSDDVSEHIRDPRVDAWNEVPSGVAGSITPAVVEAIDLAQQTATDVANLSGSSKPSGNAADQLAAVGTISIERFIGLAAPLMATIGLYSLFGGLHDVASVYTKGDLSSDMYRFGLIGSSAPSLFKTMLGVSLITFAQITSNRRWVSWILCGVLAILSIAMFTLVPLFLLDSVQARGFLPPNFAGNVLLLSASFVTSFLIGSGTTFAVCAMTLRRHASFLATDKKTIAKAWDK